MAVPIKMRRGTAAQWASANPILAAGEIGLETDTERFKFGDGVLHYSDRRYFSNIDLADPLIQEAVENATTLAQSYADAASGTADYCEDRATAAAASASDASSAATSANNAKIAAQAVGTTNDTVTLGLFNNAASQTRVKADGLYKTITGLLSARPSASSALNKQMYYATDTGDLYLCVSPSWLLINRSVMQIDVVPTLSNSFEYDDAVGALLTRTGNQVRLQASFGQDDDGIAAGWPVFTIPADYRPAEDVIAYFQRTGTHVNFPVKVLTSGTIIFSATSPGSSHYNVNIGWGINT